MYAKLKYIILTFLLIGLGFTIFNYTKISEYFSFFENKSFFEFILFSGFGIPLVLISILIIFFFLPRKLKTQKKYLTLSALTLSFIFMLISINSIFPFSFSLISFKDYSSENYPKLVSKTGTYEHIESCYFIQTDDLNVFPKRIKDSMLSYYKKRIGTEYFNKLKFDFGYINSDKPIESSNKNSKIDSSLFDYWDKPEKCDSTYVYPVYTTAFNIENPEIGIEKLAVNLVMDNNGKIIKDFQYPHNEKNVNELKIIPIDSMNSVLIQRNISNEYLSIGIQYDEITGFLFWTASTNLEPNSYSCLLNYKSHFKMNMFTGDITEYK